MSDIEDKEKNFENVSAYLKMAGFTSVVLYTPDGVITFGNQEEILHTYVHCDKHFMADVLPEIILGADVDELVKIIREHQ
jgi:nitrogen regulatory protein PII